MDKLELNLEETQEQKQELTPKREVPKQEGTKAYNTEETESEWGGLYHCMIDDAAFYKHPASSLPSSAVFLPRRPWR